MLCAVIAVYVDDGDTLNGTVTIIRNVRWGKSYKCTTRKVNSVLTSEVSTGTATVMFQELQLQVFNFTTSGFTSGMLVFT